MNLSKNNIEKILDVIIAFNNEKDYYDLLNVILTKMMEMTNADGGTLYVVENGELHFRIMRTLSLNIFQGARDPIDLPPISLDENNIKNISAYAAIKNEIVSVDDVYNSVEFNFSGPKKYDEITNYHTQSMLVFPLATTDNDVVEVIGVIQLINSIDEQTGEVRPFTVVCDTAFLQSLSNISANALANLQYAKEIKELFNSFVSVMTKAIDERSPYNVNHTKNAAKYCSSFTKFLGKKFPKSHKFHFSENRREQIVMAAYLHDIGKIITPLNIMDKSDRLGKELEIIKLKFEIKKHQLAIEHNKILINAEQYKSSLYELEKALYLIETLNKAVFLTDDKISEIKKLMDITYIDENGNKVPILNSLNIDALTVRKGNLTDAERKTMQDHVLVTGRLLDKMTFNKYFQDVPSWAKSHHEFLDGTGYPEGLKNGSISTETCILTIIDIFEALVARDRPYKKAVEPDKALVILSEMASEGKLHKELVDLFIESKVWEN